MTAPTKWPGRACGRSALASLLACVVLALATSSCAISSERDDERAVAWTRAYLDARCRYHVRCEAQFGRFAAREQAVCHPDSWATVLLDRAERVGAAFAFDADRAARCLAAIEDASCRAPEGALLAPDLHGCDDVVHGVVPAGDACDPTEYGACADGICVATDGACGGVCVARAQRGEPCRFRGCVDGLQCRFGADDVPRCRAIDLEPGAECGELEQCRSVDDRRHACVEGVCTPIPTAGPGAPCGMSIADCDAASVCLSGTCVERVGEGGACASGLECLDGLRCEDARCVPFDLPECSVPADCPPATPYCVRTDDSTRCSADPTGQPCHPSPGGLWTFLAPDSCPETHRCNQAEGPPGVVCLPIVPLGAACDGEHLCDDGARCVEGRCVVLVDPGEACGASAACPLTHACVDGSCAPLPTLGDRCDGPCFEGGCRDGTCALLPEGEACDGLLDPWVQRCEGRCRLDLCTGARAPLGAACGGALCEHGLLCVPQSDDTGLCATRCSG